METMSINGKNILRLEFFLIVIRVLQSEFLLEVYQMISHKQKIWKPAKHVVLI